MLEQNGCELIRLAALAFAQSNSAAPPWADERNVGEFIRAILARAGSDDPAGDSGAPTPVAVHCDTDGKIDPVALDERYLTGAREAGAMILSGARVTSILSTGGRVSRVVLK